MIESKNIRSLKSKLYSLIEQMSDTELEKAWIYLQTLHYDSFMLVAIQKSKTSHQPGDSLTKEEAIQILYLDKKNN